MRSTLIPAVLLAAVSIPIAEAGPCSGPTPDAVLECLSQAYAARDIDAYADMIAEDFTFGFADDPSTHWARDEDVEGTDRLFQDDDVRSIALRFEPAGTVEPGSKPGHWWLRGVASTLTVRLHSMEEPLVVTSVSDLLVRETSGEPSRYRVAKWIDVGEHE